MQRLDRRARGDGQGHPAAGRPAPEDHGDPRRGGHREGHDQVRPALQSLCSGCRAESDVSRPTGCTVSKPSLLDTWSSSCLRLFPFLPSPFDLRLHHPSILPLLPPSFAARCPHSPPSRPHSAPAPFALHPLAVRRSAWLSQWILVPSRYPRGHRGVALSGAVRPSELQHPFVSLPLSLSYNPLRPCKKHRVAVVFLAQRSRGCRAVSGMQARAEESSLERAALRPLSSSSSPHAASSRSSPGVDAPPCLDDSPTQQAPSHALPVAFPPRSPPCPALLLALLPLRLRRPATFGRPCPGAAAAALGARRDGARGAVAGPEGR